MFRFEHSEYFLLLLLLPLFILLFGIAQHLRSKKLKAFSNEALLKQLIPELPKFKRLSKFLLAMLAFACLVVALANPQFGTKTQKIKRQGVDVMIAIDVSKSMMAEDMAPNRLDRSKQFVYKLIEDLQNDRVGIIVFAGNAYLQVPITIDYSAAKLFLNNINTDIVPTQGTAVGAAIDLAMLSFDEDEKKYKTIVIISDGENHEDDAEKAASEAYDEGVTIHTIGVGTDKGAPIPILQRGKQVDYLRDKSGEVVLSKMDEKKMQRIAKKGGGQYMRLKSGVYEAKSIIEEINKMEKRELEERVFTDYEDWFQVPLAIAILLLILEFLLSERKSRWFSEWEIFKSNNKS